MKLKNINGKSIYKNCAKYRADWSQDCRSKVQKKVKQFLKKHWQLHIVYEEFPVYGTRMTVDIFNATKMIAIEIDGAQHGKFNPFFHNGDRANFLGQIQRDTKKEDWLESNDIKLVRIHEDELKKITTQAEFDALFAKLLA